MRAKFAWLLVIGLASCGDNGLRLAFPQRSGSPQGSGEILVNIAPGATNLGSQAFGLNPLSVPITSTVTWINQDTTAHTSTETTRLWDSGLISPGQSFSHTFNTGGTFSYYCTVHPNETGTIQVVSLPTGLPTPVPVPTPGPSPL